MVFSEIHVESRVLQGGQKDVPQVLPFGHAALKGLSAQHPRSKDGVTLVVKQRRDELGDDGRVILMVGMDHDHDIAAELERLAVAGLLVAAIPLVFLMDEDAEPAAWPA